MAIQPPLPPNPFFGTGVSTKPSEPTKLEKMKASCKAKGGRWDPENNTCILPEGATTVKDKTKVPIVGKDEKGQVTNITRPNGETLVTAGLPRSEARALAERQAGLAAPVAGTISRTDFNIQQQAQAQALEDEQRKIQLAQGVGNIDPNISLAAEEQGINWKEAVLAGGSDVIPGAIGYGGTAAAGAFALNAAPGVGQVAYGVAVTAGVTVGAIKSFYNGVAANIKAQKGDLIGGKTKELSSRQKAMKGYISDANMNPAAAEEMLLAYQIEKALIRKDYNTLNAEAGEVSSLMGGQDGTPQIIAYDVYFESVEPQLDRKMQQAILKPEPTRAYVNAEDLE